MPVSVTENRERLSPANLMQWPSDVWFLFLFFTFTLPRSGSVQVSWRAAEIGGLLELPVRLLQEGGQELRVNQEDCRLCEGQALEQTPHRLRL